MVDKYYVSEEDRRRLVKAESNLGENDIGPAEFGVADEPMEVSRRSFLKMAGFSFAGLVLAGCAEAPVQKAIPFLIQPEEIIPGKALWYASTCHGCSARCGVLVKNRDGRPIKLEGNPQHPLSRGGLCAVGQAQVLSLYDSHRLSRPRANGNELNWDELDVRVREAISKASAGGKEVVVLTGTINSPSLQKTLDKFISNIKNASHLTYEALSSSAIIHAHSLAYGQPVLPHYQFGEADLILSFDADFLGTWISPVEFTKAYFSRRDPDGDQFSEHIQVESRMSLTGTKADQRMLRSPGQTSRIVNDVLGELQGRHTGSHDAEKLAEKLNRAKGRSLVVSGSDDAAVQEAICHINDRLGNIGNTVILSQPSFQRRAITDEFNKLVTRMSDGKVGTLIIAGVNPVADLPDSVGLRNAINMVDNVVAITGLANETTALAAIHVPETHFLESWMDVEPVAGVLSMTQPVIAPLMDGRTLRENLSRWMGNAKDDYSLVRDYWQGVYAARKSDNRSFKDFWNKLVHDGYAEVQPGSVRIGRIRNRQLKIGPALMAGGENSLTLQLFPAISMLDGSHAENAWLQELPDPICKTTWGNVASFSPDKADALGVEQGDVVRLSVDGRSIELPAFIQPGQHNDIVTVAIGYGRMGTARFENVGPQWLEAKPTLNSDGVVGVNVAPLQAHDGQAITISKTGAQMALALTQTYNSLEMPSHISPPAMPKRPFVGETTIEAYRQDPHSGNPTTGHGMVSLWKQDHPFEGRHWGMAVDLSRCTGCSACLISCQVENNVPVVGKDEVRRRREMHWIRIDRYYSGEGENVDVAHQPMMCQHCDNAPCEPVCPVLATVHSSEGLNQQVYNRCVGTRFCANNCPYKVRRFNWFNYAHDDQLENMVLNPDLTVRTRGIMEKCSMCIQRIQEAKSAAKVEGRILVDGDIKTACQQSCPADAIVFGDLNDPESQIRKLAEGPRHYHVLEELNVKPTVGYLTIVRNRAGGIEENDHV